MLCNTFFNGIIKFGMALAILFLAGCGNREPKSDRFQSIDPDQGQSSRTSGKAKPGSSSDEPPSVILAITGQQVGYLEPCGCTMGQTGGLGRRQDLLNKLSADGTPVIPIDLGSLIEDPATSRGGPDQVRIKFGIALKALQSMGYRALALSADDLKLGVGEYFGQLVNQSEGPTVLAANVEPVEGLETIIRPVLRIEAGPLKIGITSVLAPEDYERLKDQEKVVFFEAVTDPAEALPAILADLQADTDLQVLLVQGPSELATRWAEEIPGFEIVVSTTDFDDPPAQAVELHDGATKLISVGRKGKYVGLVDLSSDGQVSYRRRRLDTRFENVEPMKSLIDDEYTRELASFGVLENFLRIPHPSGASFVGVESCKSCHPKTVEKWETTKHARAYPALIDGPRGNRTADAECISCHTTGFGFESGFVNAEQTSFLKNQQCENCHGPASKHVSDPTNVEYRQEIAIKADYADKSGLCVRCHDADNDPEYSFAERWPMVIHSGLDTYEDPKVQQGLDLEEILGKRE